MSTSEKLQQVIADAEKLSGELMSFANDAENDSVSEMYKEMSEKIEDMIPHLRGRLNHVQDH